MSEPTKERFVTDLHVYDWPDAQVQLSGFKRGSETFSALVTVVDTDENLSEIETVNLLAGRTRSGLAKTLASAKTTVEEWQSRLKYIAYTSLQEWAEGSSTLVSLPDVEVDYSQPKLLLPPFVPDSGVVVEYGDGCVAAGTMIEGPWGAARVEDLADAGEPIEVWTLSPNGVTTAIASAPWKKGTSTLYRFVLASGHEVTVAGEHRFLTPAGWAFASLLGIGSRLAVRAPYLPQTKPAHGLPVSRGGGRSSSRTDGGSTGRCSTCSRRCDRRPLSVAVADQATAPSATGAHARSPMLFAQDAPSELAQARTRTCRRCGSLGSASQPGGAECRDAASRATQRSASSRAVLPSPRESFAVQTTNESLRCATQPSRGLDQSWGKPSELPLSPANYSTIVSVSVVGVGDYYDLTVPVTHNYSANGMWHHNSAGKSMFVLAQLLTICTGYPFLGVSPTRVGPVGYYDWEDSAQTIKERAQALCDAAQVNLPPTFMYREMDRPVGAGEERIRREVQETGMICAAFDSMGMMLGGDPSDAVLVIPAMNAMKRTGIAAIGIHHLSAEAAKSTDLRDKQKGYGSVYVRTGARLQFFIDRFQEEEADEGYLYAFHTKVNRGKKSKPLAWHISYENDDQGYLRGLTYTGKSASDYFSRLKQNQPTESMTVMDAIRTFLTRRTAAGTALYPVETITAGVIEMRGQEVSEQVVINKLNEGKRNGEFVNFPAQDNPRKRVWAMASGREDF